MPQKTDYVKEKLSLDDATVPISSQLLHSSVYRLSYRAWPWFRIVSSLSGSLSVFSGRENLSFKLTTASIERVSVGGKSGRGDPLLMIILFSSLFPTLPLFLLLNFFLSLAWVNFKLAIGCPCSYLLEKSKNIHPYSILCLRLCSFSLLSYKVTQLRLYSIIFLVQVVLKRIELG